MIALSDLVIPPRVLIYGEPSTGKTFLVGKLAAAGMNILLLDADRGAMTLRQFPKEAQARITYVNIADLPGNYRAAKSLWNLLKASATAPLKVCEKHHTYSCTSCKEGGTVFTKESLHASNTIVVLDTWTAVAESASGEANKELDFGEKSSWDNFGKLKNQLTPLKIGLKNFPLPLLVLAHSIDIEEGDADKRRLVKIAPMGGSKDFAQSFAGGFDHVLYTYFSTGGTHKVAGSQAQYRLSYARSRDGRDFATDPAAALAAVYSEYFSDKR